MTCIMKNQFVEYYFNKTRDTHLILYINYKVDIQLYLIFLSIKGMRDIKNLSFTATYSCFFLVFLMLFLCSLCSYVILFLIITSLANNIILFYTLFFYY